MQAVHTNEDVQFTHSARSEEQGSHSFEAKLTANVSLTQAVQIVDELQFKQAVNTS